MGIEARSARSVKSMVPSTHEHSRIESDDDSDHDDNLWDTPSAGEEPEWEVWSEWWADGNATVMWRGHAEMCLKDLKGLIADIGKFSAESQGLGRFQLLGGLVIPARGYRHGPAVCPATILIADTERLIDVHLGEEDDGFGADASDDDLSVVDKDTEIMEWCAECRGDVATARVAHKALVCLWRQTEEAVDEWRTPVDAGQERGLPTVDETAAAVDTFKTALQALQLQFEKLFPSKRTVFTRMLMDNELNARERRYLLSVLSA